MLRILHLSLADDLGGAHKIAYELMKGGRSRGHESHLIVGDKLRDDPHVIEIPNNAYRNSWAGFWSERQKRYNKQNKRTSARFAGWMSVLGELGRWRESKRGLEDFNYPATEHLFDLLPHRPQIVHAHNLHGGYFDLRKIADLSRQVPVILTLHDEWSFTGHCSYTLGCERWENGCGNCPHLDTYPALRSDGTSDNWKRKQSIYSQSRLYVSSSSKWLLDRANRSILRPAMIESRIIPYGIDLSVFKPGDKLAARKALGISTRARIVLFIANRTYSNQFKDYRTIEEAVRIIAEKCDSDETVFLCVGEEKQEQRIGSAIIRYIGFERDPLKVAEFYRASDLYLHAAKAEAFGLVIAEAQACGTPVVATEIGGIPEVIQDKVTGFLARPADSDSMAELALTLLKDDVLRQKFSIQAVAFAKQRFDLKRHVDDYMMWYCEILESTDVTG